MSFFFSVRLLAWKGQHCDYTVHQPTKVHLMTVPGSGHSHFIVITKYHYLSVLLHTQQLGFSLLVGR